MRDIEQGEEQLPMTERRLKLGGPLSTTISSTKDTLDEMNPFLPSSQWLYSAWSTLYVQPSMIRRASLIPPTVPMALKVSRNISSNCRPARRGLISKGNDWDTTTCQSNEGPTDWRKGDLNTTSPVIISFKRKPLRVSTPETTVRCGLMSKECIYWMGGAEGEKYCSAEVESLEEGGGREGHIAQCVGNDVRKAVLLQGHEFLWSSEAQIILPVRRELTMKWVPENGTLEPIKTRLSFSRREEKDEDGWPTLVE
ncbi:hypothetical protein DL96DRAFT_1567398 [Flagelloscypha sp. PMI_526]|nr:hypothetical protein DL96DRAFT_1567398 [Flagelloscypha sp. PMI_526]